MKQFAVSSILAPTDLSDSTLPALEYARLFADRFNAQLTLMYADPLVYPVEFGVPSQALYIDASPEHKARLRREVAMHAAPVMEDRMYQIDVTVGLPIPAIISAASERKADLIVTGTHLRHGWRRALLGSVSDGVIHGAHCPVMTVAGQDHRVGRGRRAITNIICPINFTPVSRDSLHVAARLAEAFGAHLEIVHVIEPDETTDAAADEQKIRLWVEPELQEVTSYRELIVRGGAAERVLDCADDVGGDLLVVGAQHKRFRDETVIGTTTERLIRFASSPVLVVPREAVRRTTPEIEIEEPAEVMV